MKNFTTLKVLLFCGLITSTFSSCVKKDTTFQLTLIAFDMKSKPVSFDGTEKSLAIAEVLTNINQKIKDNNLDPSLLKSVKLNSLKINVASGENFDKIDYALANVMKTGLPTVKIAYAEKGDFVKGSSSHTFKNNYTEMIDYVKTDTFKMEFKGYNNDSLPSMTFTANVVFDLVVGASK